MDETFPDKHIDVAKNLKGQMKDLVVMSMQSVRKKLNENGRNFCFEIFGYDFFIDEAFKVWLIEVNTNPCLEESSALLKMYMPRMVDDALRLTVDQVFPRKRKIEPLVYEPSIYKVTGYPDNENMWEYLCQIGIIKATANYKTATANLYKSPPAKSGALGAQQAILSESQSAGLGVKEENGETGERKESGEGEVKKVEEKKEEKQ